MAADETNQFRGIIPPILTPLQADGMVDLRSLFRLTRWLLHEGVHGIWACGTTGEFACIDADEREHTIGTCVEAADGRVPVIANISDCSTRLVIEHGKRALRAGADAVAVTPPYYYVNSQDELLDLYRAVRDAIDAPLFVYNIPATVKVKVEIPTIATLAEEGTIAGIKDSQNDLDFARGLIQAVEERGASLRVFLGTRSLIDAGLLIGAHGAIPGIANVVPRACVQVYEAALKGDWDAAAAAQRLVNAAMQLTRVVKGSAHSAGMGGMKAALKAMGVIATAYVAHPLRTPSDEEQDRIAQLVREFGLRAPVPA
jgi:4-hydroxy-tetrahydrodipicolinate synthase